MKLRPAHSLQLSPAELQVLQLHRAHLEAWGWQFTHTASSHVSGAMVTHAAAVLGTPLNSTELQVGCPGICSLMSVASTVATSVAIHAVRAVPESIKAAFSHVHMNWHLKNALCNAHPKNSIISVQCFLQQLGQTDGVARVPQAVHRLLVSKACHSAIRQAHALLSCVMLP